MVSPVNAARERRWFGSAMRAGRVADDCLGGAVDGVVAGRIVALRAPARERLARFLGRQSGNL
jgi:hypothetical protein